MSLLGTTVAVGVSLTLPWKVCVLTVLGEMVTLYVPVPLSNSPVGAVALNV